MAVAKKIQANKFDTRLAINGPFEDVIKVPVETNPSPKLISRHQKRNNENGKTII